jgi:hypothetical protein
MDLDNKPKEISTKPKQEGRERTKQLRLEIAQPPQTKSTMPPRIS